jgi:hypothetical protein
VYRFLFYNRVFKLSYSASGLGEEASSDFIAVFFGFCLGYGDFIMYFMFIVDSYTCKIYPFNTLVVMLRQKIIFPRKQSLKKFEKGVSAF